MTNATLAAKAASLGLKPEGSEDANKVLAEVASSREGGFWEAFPLLLANAAAAGRFDYAAAESLLPAEEKKLLKPLIFLSLGVYASIRLRAPWKGRLAAGLPARMTESFRQKVEEGSPFEISGVTVRPEKLVAIFGEGYDAGAAGSGLEAALSTLFTQRQRDLLMKKLRRAPLTKTEREYYSRVIKKKVVALANSELHALARRALE